MTVDELVAKLSDVPADWVVYGNKAGSLSVFDPRGLTFGWVFTDDRPTKLLQQRHP